MPGENNLAEALAVLAAFLRGSGLTGRVADLEHALDGCRGDQLDTLLREHGVTAELFQAALLAREQLGRVSDLIHASAIALALPRLLETGETMRRPSLAAGNDPSRPYDVETDRRIAEFKLGRWDGQDAMRKRHVFKDLVNLASDTSGRIVELYVLGARPIRFLRTSHSTAAWALEPFRSTRELFVARFGSLDIGISDFVSGPGAHVSLVDLAERCPELFGP